MDRATLVRSQLQALFVFKAPPTMLGWIWKAALVLNIQRLMQPRWKMGGKRGGIRERSDTSSYVSTDEHAPRPIFTLLSYLIVYALLLVACELLQILMQRRSQRTSTSASSGSRSTLARRHEINAFRRKLLVMGLSLIPAWGFKDVVGSFISWMQDVSRIDNAGLPTVLVISIALCLAFVLPEKTEGASFCVSVLGAVNASLGLGVAYAFNQVVKDAAGDRWSEIWFQATYVPIVTLCMSLFRPKLISLKEGLQSLRAKKLVEFLAGTSGYMVAWSWNQFLVNVGDAVWKTDNDWIEVWRQLLWACLVTGIAAVTVALLPAMADFGLQSLIAITVLSAGINVGSFWSNVASAVYDAWGGGLLLCWLLVMIVTIFVPPIAFSIDRLLQPKVDVEESEIQKQVQLSDDGGEGGTSFVSDVDGEGGS